MFIAALFIKVKIRKQLKCLLMDKWIMKVSNTYTMEYYSTMRKKETLPYATTLVDFKDIILNEKDQKEKV